MPTPSAPTSSPHQAKDVPVVPTVCLSFDVEEHYHIEAARGRVAKESWPNFASRVEKNVDLLLDLLAQAGAKATFFVLGDVARRCPLLARRIFQAGHEIASHGFGHDRIHRLTPAQFRQDVAAGKAILEDQTGQAVLGYRAPTFSLTVDTAWAIDILAELGLVYDASIFPVRHPWYGVRHAPLSPFFVRAGAKGRSMLEVPPLVWQFAGGRVAAAGGGYFRLLPLWIMERGLAQAAAAGRPAVLYFHPWEFDPDQPRMPLTIANRIRTYTGLRSAAKKLQRIMRRSSRWITLQQALPELTRQASLREPLGLYGVKR
ncbi:MAG: DUF3473 domain-containing protein [Phycisphaeraceae bacterium]|nr:DUF3473 domain-containing protein [Phycisphaeraceae bacterium]